MNLRVLVDNNTYIDRYFIGEPALSFFIEDREKRILFDTGYSHAFIHNAEKMRINLRKLHYIALSHGHIDHTWGLTDLVRLFMEAKGEKIDHTIPTVIGHPLVFNSKLFPSEGEIGSLLSEEKVNYHFPVHLSREPFWLTEKLVFLGEIDRKFDFEEDEPIGSVIIEEQYEDDYVVDDTALVYKAKEGLVVIVGCAHSGLCNIIEQAKMVCEEERVISVIGGFHLLNPSKNRIEKTVSYLEKLELQSLYPCHCTDLQSKIALARTGIVKEVGVGLNIEWK
ncbi:MBL fold metallo-hydrolase [Priestia endophytica]|jgi:7,8-dihydropterin-6-yl-methyl-4-(beta-D-ribofuranosyl)aminobenzene 5'-phosphate synthase|uniref:MBL fold metallo-hydrolase n=1 Tax=Priestia endophytica TaxID=135735 RepID=A0AAX1QA37_9BACI|nr:MBL fold metallo-hydrolase [Priestia endophytica]MCM3539938.1 MBL fold metallo-hydrolase [Priestia endophytica]RAS77642.1 MBL fold metallo-hydrolase [Priestia endophytica]RAS93005.1 MBL fold metallo-hydrolase [Priestia endophytica]